MDRATDSAANTNSQSKVSSVQPECRQEANLALVSETVLRWEVGAETSGRNRKRVFPGVQTFGMISVALAGKPNAGKSTFYTAATMADVDVANYPFTTIDANRGMTSVRTDCPCLARDRRCGDERCRDGVRYVPIEMTDVAGLVPGAHEGKGLGNQFLDELTNADVILNVIDASGGLTPRGNRCPSEPEIRSRISTLSKKRWTSGWRESSAATGKRSDGEPGRQISTSMQR
ncbi:MAG: 50S ribosome-binding GTPase [uncultured archaeon A07HR60]|nr:MAG: 50S ribosome-binding GTPase [uncultured archaeon A07HR60]